MSKYFGIKEIVLTQGKVAIVDHCNSNIGGKYKWYYSTTGYARNWSKKKGSKIRTGCYLQHALMWCPKGYQIDHINGDKLDNRMENLRIVTYKQNAQNSAIKSNNTSGYKGVSLTKEKNKWRAYININKKQVNLGRFIKKEDAAKAYNIAATKHFGKYARLNNLN